MVFAIRIAHSIRITEIVCFTIHFIREGNQNDELRISTSSLAYVISGAGRIDNVSRFAMEADSI